MGHGSPEVRVTVVVVPDRFAEVVHAPAIGTVSGRIAAATPEALAAISAIDGVVAVEPEREIHLPPPESGVP